MKRWRDDSEFQSETGIALGDDELLAVSCDVSAVRRALIDSTSGGAYSLTSPSTLGTALPLKALLFVAVVAVGALVLDGLSSSPEPSISRQTAMPAVDSNLSKPEPVDMVAPVAAPEPPLVAKMDPAVPEAPPAKARKAKSGAAGDFEDVTRSLEQAAAVREQAKPSALAIELEDYELAKRTAGPPSLRVAAWQSFLKNHPQGTLELEARLQHLDALMRGKRWGSASTVVSRLLKDGRFESRHPELWAVLGEILVVQRRCAAAASAFVQSNATLDRSEAALRVCIPPRGSK